MEWNQPLFDAFMVAVVGNLLFISTMMLLNSLKKPEVKAERRHQCEHYPVCDLRDCLHRMKLEPDKRELARMVKSFGDPTDGEAGRGGDEAPPVG